MEEVIRSTEANDKGSDDVIRLDSRLRRIMISGQTVRVILKHSASESVMERLCQIKGWLTAVDFFRHPSGFAGVVILKASGHVDFSRGAVIEVINHALRDIDGEKSTADERPLSREEQNYENGLVARKNQALKVAADEEEKIRRRDAAVVSAMSF